MRWANLDKLWPPTQLGFWLIVLVPLFIIGFALLFHWRRRVMESLGDLEQLRKMAQSVSRPRRIAKAILLVVAFVLGVVAWVRPQTEGKSEWVKRVGLDLVVVMDFSKSMYARDISRSRIEKAKEELGRFIDSLDGDRVGLVAFAGTVKEFPLTTDYNAAKLFFEDLTPNDMPIGGTAIGRALSAAVRMLQRSRKGGGKRRAQVIVLLTDGEDHQSEPIKAAKMAAKLGIKVFALGIGSRSGDLVPVVTDEGDVGGTMKNDKNRPVVTRLDEKTLRKVADLTEGKYFRATAAGFGMGKIRKEMKGLKRAETKARMKRNYIEQYHWFLFPAPFLLLLELVMSDRVVRSSEGREKRRDDEEKKVKGLGPQKKEKSSR